MPWVKDANFSVHTLIEALIDWIEQRFGRGRIMAAGHRVVLGGLEHTVPVLLDAALLDRLRALVPLAPMHQPRNLEPIEALAKLSPNMPQVACFDTAFHRTIPESRAALRPAASADRGGRSTLRLSRALLRIHCQRPTAVR